MGQEVGQSGDRKEDLEERNGTVQQKGVARQRIKDDYRNKVAVGQLIYGDTRNTM